MDEEAEPQVVQAERARRARRACSDARSRRSTVAGDAARPRGRGRGSRSRRRAAPCASTAWRRRAAARRAASTSPRVSSSASGSRSSSRDGLGVLAEARPRAGRARSRRPGRAPRACGRSTSRWWKTFCSTPRSASSSGSTCAVMPCASISCSPVRTAGERISCLSSPKMRSAATRSSPGAARPIAARRVRLDRAGRGRPRAARRAACAAGRRRARRRATMRSRRASRSARPPCGSSSSPPASGSAIALTVKSRAARSASMSPSRSDDEVDVPGVAGADDAPGAERAREPERRAAGRARERARGVLGVVREREVEVGRRAAEQPVAHGAADDPRLAAGEDRADRVERRRARSRAPPPPRWCSRGTRALIPHVIS